MTVPYLHARVRLYKAFCVSRNTAKLELLNEQVLRVICNDRSFSNNDLLHRFQLLTLRDEIFLHMLVPDFKCLAGMAPEYLVHYLKGVVKLPIPKVESTKFSLQSFRYLAARLCNSLSDETRTTATAHVSRAK